MSQYTKKELEKAINITTPAGYLIIDNLLAEAENDN